MKWNKDKDKYLISLVTIHGKKWQFVAKEMENKFGETFSSEQVRSRWRTELQYEKAETEDIPAYNETTKILENGNIETDRLIELSEEEEKDKDSVLIAHGYDPVEWEIVKATSSKWHHFNKEMSSPKTMYASKVTVKPKVNGFDWGRLLDEIKQTPTVNIETYIPNATTYLNIPLADMHFGVADYDYYKETQSKIINLIRNKHEEVLFIIGNDLLHVDNFRNTTSSGREIQQIDMVQAWKDAKAFYYPLLGYALENSNKVKIMYIKGNHSESMEWAFVQMLKARFPQIIFDDEFKERKVHMLGLNFCGANHGDKKKMKNISENFAVEFPIEWSKAKTRTVFTAHLHHELVIDKGGIVIRQLSTRVPADIWHDDMGYTTAHKRFQVHEYDYDAERCIHYV
ncbi:SANT/Myb-like DNA-binding domain-containing protein [Virgibacillus sp. C22-A2]|uniref:SANT/Myb-like DNA-binding domain-containing protein n=1 Tax=Virgibacillus tibetensis TaxID=3042313 RepID=A0ABU6KBB9_9BACI|nr:SANT/Myb-like DNA-binding domain-containing protein [Virgibacillus sp. C22-A2]